jgi:8-oxo-dGTP diphosphatase
MNERLVEPERPLASVGIIITNDVGEVFVFKRIGDHAPGFSIPGGKIKNGKTSKETVIEEAAEEVGIEVIKAAGVAFVDDMETFQKEGIQPLSIIYWVVKYKGEPRIMEPEKHAEPMWVNPHNLPEPHFSASRDGVACWLSGVISLDSDPI